LATCFSTARSLTVSWSAIAAFERALGHQGQDLALTGLSASIVARRRLAPTGSGYREPPAPVRARPAAADTLFGDPV